MAYFLHEHYRRIRYRQIRRELGAEITSFLLEEEKRAQQQEYMTEPLRRIETEEGRVQ